MDTNILTFFRGFVKTKNKKSVDKFKNVPDDELLTYDEAKNLPEFAGVLAEDAALFDFDDPEQAECAFNIVKGLDLKCAVIKTTRGKHILLKNDGKIKFCKTKTRIACGLTCDIKVGCKNSYEVLKFDKKERTVERNIADGEEYQTEPVFFHPVKTTIDLWNLSEGDGRNDDIFKYILVLQSQLQLSPDDIRDMYRTVINPYVFREPLSENELDVILRDDAFGKPTFYKGKTFLHEEFARYIMNTRHIIRTEKKGGLMIYSDGVYEYDAEEIEQAIFANLENSKVTQRKEVMMSLRLLCHEVKKPVEWKIAFRNGVYDIDTKTLEGFTPDYVLTNKIPWDYNPEAYDQLTDDTLNKVSCGNMQIRKLLEEMIGACMCRSTTLGGGKAFILTGSGANGKSTLLGAIQYMLGKENYSVLDMKEISDRFSTIMLYNKLANVGGDMSDEYIPDDSIFKKAVTGEEISAEQKGEPKMFFKPYCTFIFGANTIPRIGKGKDAKAIARRLIIVPFNAVFDKDSSDYDPEISSKLHTQQAMEYLIRIGLEGLERVRSSKQFTTSEEMQKELEEFTLSNNPVLSFIREWTEDGKKFENEEVNLIYQKYNEFCIRGNYRPLRKADFSKELQKNVNVKSHQVRLKGVRTSVYLKC